MEKLKKVMILMALVGTVAVTAFFLYYPIRQMVREWKHQSISLGEDTAGTVGEYREAAAKAEASAENPKDMKANAAAPAEGAETQLDVALSLGLNQETCTVGLWRNESSQFYFFLPGFAAGESCKILLDRCESGGYAVIDGKRINEGDVITDISGEREYALQIYSRRDELLAQGPLIFLDAGNVPAVFINTQSDSMDIVHAQKGNTDTGDIAVFDQQGALQCREELEEISGRGNSTWGLDKKSYQIKLSKSENLFDFGTGKSWTLLANGYDDTGLRNLLVMDLAKRLGLTATPNGTMVSLYCNGEYYGLYYFCEKVQVGEERVDIRDLEEETRSVYQNTDLEKLKTGAGDGKKWIELEYNPADISGGYLIEREFPERYEENSICGFETTQGDFYSIKSPEYASYEQVTYIAGLMQEAQDAAADSRGINPVTGKHYTEYFDLETFAKKYLVEEISKNYDGGVTSSFFYKPADDESTRLFAGPVWDYDVAFGNCSLDAINSDPMGISRLGDHILGTGLFINLYEKEEFRSLVEEYYRTLALPWLEEMLQGGLAEYGSFYQAAVQANQIRWENMINRYRYYESNENNLRYLNWFIEERTAFLNDVWIDGIDYHCVSFEANGHIWKKIYVRDGESAGSAPIPVSYSGSVFGGYYREGNWAPYDEYRPVYEDITFHAIWHEPAELEIAGE